MTVGARIKQIREAQGLSRPELVTKSGVPYPTLAGLENGDQKDSTKLHAIAGALGVSVQWLATGKEPKTSATALQPALDKAAQPVRLDPEIIVRTANALGLLLSRADDTLDLSRLQHARWFAASYQAATEEAESDAEPGIALGAAIAAIIREESNDGREDVATGRRDRARARK